MTLRRFPAAAGVAFLLAAALGCSTAVPVGPDHAAPPGQPAFDVPTPDELTPMTLDAALTKASAAPGDTVAVKVGVRLLPGWHTYALVPPEEPYVQTRWTLEPGAGLTPSGDWIAPPPVEDAANPRLKLYESTPEPLLFLHPLQVADTASGEASVRVSVLFQVCDMSRCLPPEEKTFDLKLKIAANK